MTAVRVPLAASALALSFLAASSLPFAPAASAHHGWSGYDTKLETLTGTVQEVAFGNPHAMITLKAGEKSWHVVLAPPFRMSARGLPEGTLKTGQTVTVEGYSSRSDGSELRAERISLDGKPVELR